MQLILDYMLRMGGYCLLGAAICLIVLALRHRRTHTAWGHRDLLLILLTAYCVGLGSQTIMPRWDAGIDSATGLPYLDVYLHNDLAFVNLIPFRTIRSQLPGLISSRGYIRAHSVLNLVGNLLVFSPFGILLPLLWPRFQRLGHILAAGAIISTGIEVIQLFVGRSTDIDDVIFNTAGVLIGYGLCRLIRSSTAKRSSA